MDAVSSFASRLVGRPLRPLGALAVLSAAAAIAACAQSKKFPIVLEDDGGSPRRDASSEEEDDQDADAFDPFDAGRGDGGAVGTVYAHSPRSLYRLDPDSRVLGKVGDFSCLQGEDMVDVAVNGRGEMFGTSFSGLFTIEPSTATCTVVARAADGGASYPNSLSFVPAGTLDLTREALVGYDQEDYVRIDTTTGAMSVVGNLNPNPTGLSFQSSGDIVSIDGSKTFLTAKSTVPDAGGGDYLVEVDPATGKVLRVIGDTKQKRLWGLATWAGTGFAFSGDGLAFALDLSNAAATPIPVSGLGDAGFYGAGTSTFAAR